MPKSEERPKRSFPLDHPITVGYANAVAIWRSLLRSWANAQSVKNPVYRANARLFTSQSPTCFDSSP
jgi:hypothetical protein